MTPEQATQLTQIAFVVILVIPAFVVVGVIIFIATRVIPVFIRQTQQLIDNNTNLTKISEQNIDQIKINADRIKVMELALSGIQPELVHQTNVIQEGNAKTDELGLHFRNYQTLMSDNMAAQTVELAANAEATQRVIEIAKDVSDNQRLLAEIWKRNQSTQLEDTESIKTAIETFSIKGSVPVGILAESVARMEKTLDELPHQLVMAIEDKYTCVSIIKEVQALRYEIKQVLNQQAKRITSTIPTVLPSSPEGSTS